MTTTATQPFADVPAPAGAVTTYDWDDLDTPNPSRYWAGASRRVDAQIIVDGTQWADGTMQRRLAV